MKTHFVALLVLVSISIVHPIRLSAQISPAMDSLLQNKLNSLATANRLKGISAAVYIPGKGMWQGVTGVSYGTKKIEPSMLFSIGSITKTFVAAEILKLVEEGKLSLSDTVGQYIPPHQYIKPSITIKQLLSHQAGLGDVTNQAMNDATFADLYRRWNAQEVIDSFLTAPVALPGQSFHYSNAGFILLGIIAEQIEQDSLHKIIRNRFSNPLELNNTYMHMYDPFTYKIPHNWSTPTMDPALAQDVSGYPHPALWTTTEAAGGLFSSPVDLTKWAYALYTNQVINASLVSEMTTFKVVSSSYFNGYGLGCMRFPKSGKTYIGHAGNYFGYAASMLFHPEDSICVGMLVNQDCISPNVAGTLFYTVLQNMTLSISDALKEASQTIAVYPNPVTEKLYINVPSGSVFKITLQDLSGRIVLIEKNTEVLDVSMLNKGMYIISVETATGKRIEKKLVISN